MENGNDPTGGSAESFNSDPARYRYASAQRSSTDEQGRPRRALRTWDPSQPEPPNGYPMVTPYGVPFTFRNDVDIAFAHLYPPGMELPPLDPPCPEPQHDHSEPHQDESNFFAWQERSFQMPHGTSQTVPIASQYDLPGTPDGQISDDTSQDQSTRPEAHRMHSVEEARSWRRRQVHQVTYPDIPEEFDANREQHVSRIYQAIADCNHAEDGQRLTNTRGQDQKISGSKGFKGMLKAFKADEAEAAAWIIYGDLLALHRDGSTLSAPADFAHNVKNEQNDLDLTIEERLEAVLKLMKTFKSCCLDAMGPEERKIQIMVRAPVAILRTKRQYQASNDNRKAVYASGRKNMPSKGKIISRKKASVKDGREKKTKQDETDGEGEGEGEEHEDAGVGNDEEQDEGEGGDTDEEDTYQPMKRFRRSGH